MITEWEVRTTRKEPSCKLTDEEKWKCVAIWLNRLYIASIKEEAPEIPCGECPLYFGKCGKDVPPPENFKVIEQFTGEGTIVSPLINQRTVPMWTSSV